MQRVTLSNVAPAKRTSFIEALKLHGHISDDEFAADFIDEAISMGSVNIKFHFEQFARSFAEDAKALGATAELGAAEPEPA